MFDKKVKFSSSIDGFITWHNTVRPHGRPVSLEGKGETSIQIIYKMDREVFMDPELLMWKEVD